MKTYLFPGQGSQYIGMGKALFKHFPQLTQCADDLLGYSIAECCLSDKDKQLNNTQYTQPALYVVGALSYLHQVEVDEIPADFLAGHSLGEYNALYASGAFTFEDGLKLVKKRGELMSQAARGAMAAVLDIEEQTLRDCLINNQLQAIDIANLNSNSQIVISGLVDDIARSQTRIEKSGGRFIQLNTSGAFHSRYMAPAQAQFAAYIQGFQFSNMKTPVIANVNAAPYQLSQVKQNLIEQITQPVRWRQSIEFLLTQGDMQFKELGPKKVLTKLAQHIQQNFAGNPSTSVPANLSSSPPHRELQRRKKNIEETKQTIDNWNQRYPIGTLVRISHQGDLLRTRTEAMLLFGHRAAIYLQGYKGYFSLDEVIPNSSTQDQYCQAG